MVWCCNKFFTELWPGARFCSILCNVKLSTSLWSLQRTLNMYCYYLVFPFIKILLSSDQKDVLCFHGVWEPNQWCCLSKLVFYHNFPAVIYLAHSFISFLLMYQSTEGMRSSKFCLHPAGDTPSSCRLFDAIVSHCVPVIVSDQIELPYEDEIDYSQFSVFFSINEAIQPGYMVDQLRQIPKERWIKMWKLLKNISHHFEFQYPPEKEDAVDMIWRQVKYKLPAVQLAVHRSRRLKIPDWWQRRRWFWRFL